MLKIKKIPLFFAYCLFLLVLFIHAVYAEQREIRILHMNDFHGFAIEYKPFRSDEVLGGISYLAGLVDKLRQEKPSVLFAAGDMIQGNNWANLFQGKSVIELMNVMRFDAMVVGNHEFDFGQGVLKERILEAKFPFLGANVEGLSQIQPYTIKMFEGLKIAIIGVVTEDTPLYAHPKNMVGLKFLSPAETVDKYVKDLRSKVDIIIVLSHIGFHNDMELANKVKGIDVIIGGHSHTKPVRHMLIGKTIIVQAWEHALALGVLDLIVEDGKITHASSRLEDIKPTLAKKNKAVSLVVEKYRRSVEAALNGVIGETEVSLDGENVRARETNLGNLITDIMRQRSGAEVAVINGGAIRASIKKGKVRAGDVYSALPFDNYIVAVRLTGTQIKEALEHGLSAMEDGGGRFLQVSGLTFSYASSAGKGPGVKKIFVAGKPIMFNKEYVVATNDFLAAGGDGYKVFGEALKASKDFSVNGGALKCDKIVYNDAGRWLRDVVIEYIKNAGKISVEVEGRIKKIGD